MTGKKSDEFLLVTYMTAQGEEVKASVSSVPLLVDNKVAGAVVTVFRPARQRTGNDESAGNDCHRLRQRGSLSEVRG